MRQVRFDGTFAGWRDAARDLLRRKVAPHQVEWLGSDDSGGLFDEPDVPEPSEPMSRTRIPRQLIDELESAARFRTSGRWSLLYRILWRVARGDQTARLVGDADGSELHARIKAVRRETHHMHAFLRFSPAGADEVVDYVAWFEPAHDILLSAAPHFADRMGLHSWLIATPDNAVLWDGETMHYANPCPPAWRQLAQSVEDPGAHLWKAYYESTFNPARLNREVMQSNLPVRFWKNLPEGSLIPQLMSRARAGAQRDGQAERVASRPGKRIGQSGRT
ncbi:MULTISPECIES: TIGR03915 family putative DNA repair protein [Pseudomonadaceae]|uniref:Leucyl-tRNA synthetase n=1 Tax=Stutzerimonas stutzeri TaxID=316 RepID=A0A0D9AFK2_STUST|nr:TIGR03915 family putative DNA repair protein [Stutzerimonas stutzeri]KJH79492.1 leucyl-tRNA synthetase [Stutzerimonas stutzeri]